MLKSIYTPLSGARSQQRVLEMIANNLANVNTTGYKGDRVTFTLLEPEPRHNYESPLPPANYKVAFEDLKHLKGNELAYAGVADVTRDFSQGPAIKTGNPTDLMIEGEGLLRVQTPDGVRYSRGGSLTLNHEGILTTQTGHPVMGDKGDVMLREGEFRINDQGEIWQDGEMVDRLQLFRFEDKNQLKRVGKNYYFYGGRTEGVSQMENPSVRQGYVEGSNVNAIKNLTNMITAHRSYEAYQKAIRNYDTIMEKSSNSIGSIRA